MLSEICNPVYRGVLACFHRWTVFERGAYLSPWV